jgi:hypothetical protein
MMNKMRHYGAAGAGRRGTCDAAMAVLAYCDRPTSLQVKLQSCHYLYGLAAMQQSFMHNMLFPEFFRSMAWHGKLMQEFHAHHCFRVELQHGTACPPCSSWCLRT